MAPNVPAILPSNRAPWASQVSSTTTRSWRAASAPSARMSQALPSRCTGSSARVRGPTARATASGSIVNVSRSTSTSTGTSPTFTSGKYVVDHATAGTMTSSPGTRGRGKAGLTNVAAATRLAEEPEFTITASATPRYSAHIASKRRTLSPIVTRVESRQSIASFTSSAPKDGTCRGNRTSAGRGSGSAKYCSTNARICAARAERDGLIADACGARLSDGPPGQSAPAPAREEHVHEPLGVPRLLAAGERGPHERPHHAPRPERERDHVEIHEQPQHRPVQPACGHPIGVGGRPGRVEVHRRDEELVVELDLALAL